jgi:hypothetical protein
MNSFAADQLEEAVGTLIAGKPFHFYQGDLQLEPLLAIAAELRYLPRPEFRARLRADLLQRGSHGPFDPVPQVQPAAQPPDAS